jgi:hypothetical protein
MDGKSRFVAAFGAVVAAIVAGAALASSPVDEPPPPADVPHALDDVRRRLPEGEAVDCEAVTLIEYGGTHIEYNREGEVHPEFAKRLERFEEVVVDVALEVYGRAPVRLEQRSLFRCRRTTSGSGRVSEHAFGNAIDVAAFDFPELPEGADAPPDLPEELRDGFRIDVGTHFHPATDSAIDLRHAQFFHRLMEQLEARPDIFRGMIGPPDAGHETVLHLDAGPWRYQRYDLPFG